MPTFAKLAADARPVDEADWGTDRQIEAENTFFAAFHVVMGETTDFDDWCLNATSEEMLTEALRLMQDRFGTIHDEAPAAGETSALDRVPDTWKPFTEKTRDDLRMIEEAESMGFRVTFRNGDPSNSASFGMERANVWWGSDGWRAKTIVRDADGNDAYEHDIRLYGDGMESLRQALVTEKARLTPSMAPKPF
jgi:hypothetical protein